MKEATGSGGCWGGRRRRGGAWRRGWIRDGGGGAEWALCVLARFVGLCERVVDCCVGMWTGIWGWAFLCLALPARECFLLTAGRPVRGPYVAGDGWAAGEIKRCAAADPRPCRRTARAQNFSLRLNFS